MSDYGVVAEPGTVRFERILPGPIERVWDYLTDSEKRGRWFAAGTMEPRVGGKIEFRFDHASLSPHQAPTPEKFKDLEKHEGGFKSYHRVTRFDPPRFLSFTWGEEKDPSEVNFELSADGDNVRLVLVHQRLASRADMVNVAGGWHTHLAVLTERLNDRTPPAFWTLFGNIEDEYEKRFPSDAGARSRTA